MKKKSLYILDLDHCLIYTSFNKIEGLPLISKRKWHYLYHRPNLKEFLNYITHSSDIVFYTSSKMEYAKWVVNTFELTIPYLMFTRKHTTRKQTSYGDIFLKSLDKISLSKSYNKIYVIDDRTDLWNSKGVNFIEIEPWMGEKYDTDLIQIMIKQIKSKLPKVCQFNMFKHHYRTSEE